MRRSLALGFAVGLAAAPAWCDAGASEGAFIPASARKAAPRLALRDLAGEKHKLADFRGKLAIVNFWATWCGPCRHELPAFAQIDTEYKERGVQVIAAANETKAARDHVAEYVRRVEVSFPVWIEASADDMMAFGLDGRLPSTVIVDRLGRTAARIQGETDSAGLRSLVDRLLTETPSAASGAEGSAAAKR